jgi:succinyl-CoA synthetase alpha subunit
VTIWNVVHPSRYHDSVTLVRVSRDLEALPGIRRAAAMMGTPANRDLLAGAGLLAVEGARAGPTDLVVAIDADVAEAAATARRVLETALATSRPSGGRRAAAPRTLTAARHVLDDANLALISVPGLYAGAEAAKALRAGCHVMLFSDNVPIATEVALKRLARARGRLLMGPDCGTAIIAGVPLGFANAVPRGRIGVVAASGTGAQEVTCLIAGAGEGISHALGLGGRDLSDAVGGLMLEPALRALAADASTEVICVIGKPPGPAVARRLPAWLSGVGKPCVTRFVGGARALKDSPAHPAATLEEAAMAAVALARGRAPRAAEFTRPADEIERLAALGRRALGPGQRLVRGVYAGGTLAQEAVDLLRETLDDVAPVLTGEGDGHRVVDLGADIFTVGCPHPMLDGHRRRQWLVDEGRDPRTAVLLLDIVLGHGAHPDPAGDLLPALDTLRDEMRASGRGLVMVASVCGTPEDPQPRPAQVAALESRGVLVMPSNAQAARLAARIVSGR